MNFVRMHSKKHQMVAKLCKDINADAIKLLYRAEVCWLSRGKVLKCVFELWQALCVFLAQHKHPNAIYNHDNIWLSKLSYLCSIFERINQLNLSLQGKDLMCLKQTVKLKPSNKS